MIELDDKTARCLLVQEDRYLLVVHANCSAPNRGKWGLPGGRLEVGESAEMTLRRELEEELSLVIGRVELVGRYLYRERSHRVFTSGFEGSITRWDTSEIERWDWFTLEEIEELETTGRLHQGFEAQAVRDWLAEAAARRRAAEVTGLRASGSMAR